MTRGRCGLLGLHRTALSSAPPRRFIPALTYRITNYQNLGKNLVRRYVNAGDSASCGLKIVELKVKVGDAEAVKTSATVAFTTRFTDGKVLTTCNLPLKMLRDQPAGWVVQECRQVTRIAELKRRHEVRASQMGPAIAPVRGAKAVFEEQRREHRKLSEYQLERGIYRLAPSGQEYEPTDKAWARAVLNHLNPFARRIVWQELVLSVLVGSALPLLSDRGDRATAQGTFGRGSSSNDALRNDGADCGGLWISGGHHRGELRLGTVLLDHADFLCAHAYDGGLELWLVSL